MKYLFVILLFVTFLSLGIAQEKFDDWSRVEELKQGTAVIVRTVNGTTVSGKFGNVFDHRLTIISGSAPIELQKDEISEIRKTKMRAAKMILLSAAIGAAAGLTLGAVLEGGRGGDDPGLVPVLGLVTGAAVGTGSGVLSASSPGKLIYKAPN